MSLLHVNDRPGAYPPSWYAATAQPRPEAAPLAGEVRADIAIVGGGYTGLSTALHAAQKGYDVVLLEAHRVGFGASGRNGGQASVGQRVDQEALEAAVGRDDARLLWDLSVQSVALVRGLIARHGIDAHWKDGVAWAAWTRKEADWMQGYAERIARDYGHTATEPLDRAAIRALIGSEAFQGGLIDRYSGHLHPLSLAMGLARAAEAAGARLYERSEVTAIEGGVVRTASGQVRADQVVVACNGYLGGLEPGFARRIMPINNFIVATEPLADRAETLLAEDIAVADSRFVVNYWRLSHDRRLLFGGGESYGDRFPRDIAAKVRPPMLEIYPQLRDVRIDHAWGGTLAITASRMPVFARPSPGLWSVGGYSGHGVALAVLAGQILAEAIHGDLSRFDTMARAMPPPLPRLGPLRQPLLALAMRWYALRDRLGV